jgi:hypothetical protein
MGIKDAKEFMAIVEQELENLRFNIKFLVPISKKNVSTENMSLNIELLEETFQRVKLHADQFAASFYENLFTAYPEVKPLLPKLTWQHNKKSC